MVRNDIFLINNTKNFNSLVLSQILTYCISLVILLLGLFYLKSNEYLEIQLIASYLVFSGFMHLGLIDGIELRIAGKDIDTNNNGFISSVVFILSLIPLLIYIVISSSVDINLLIAFLAFPVINLNAYFTILLRSYGHSWIAAYGIIYEKLTVFFYLVFTFFYSTALIKYFIFFSLIPLIFYYIKLKQIGIFFDFGYDKKKIHSDLKSGMNLMLSNIFYSAMSSGSIIIAAQLFSSNDVSRLAISITIINLFVGFSFQIANVIFPKISNEQNNEEFINLDNYVEIIEKIIPVIILVAIIFIHLFSNKLQYFFSNTDQLKYVAILIPLVYFEIKNQIINIVKIKLRFNLLIYLLLNLSTTLLAFALFYLTSFVHSSSFITFIYCMILTFIIRFVALSFYTKSIRSMDGLFIFIFIGYIIIFS